MENNTTLNILLHGIIHNAFFLFKSSQKSKVIYRFRFSIDYHLPKKKRKNTHFVDFFFERGILKESVEFNSL